MAAWKYSHTRDREHLLFGPFRSLRWPVAETGREPGLRISLRSQHPLGCLPAQSEQLKAYSQEALRQLPLYHYDAIYVDGSHAAADVLEDAVLSFKLLKPGGVMIFDDYEWNAFPDPWLVPLMAIDFFLQVYQRQYELLYKGYQVAIKKM
jgi:hypothetical protein